MSVLRATRRSGLILILFGVVGAFFFWLTDPRYGPVVHNTATDRLDWRYWLFVMRGSPQNLIDAANQAYLVTAVGIAGSIAVLMVGMWLISRRSL